MTDGGKFFSKSPILAYFLSVTAGSICLSASLVFSVHSNERWFEVMAKQLFFMAMIFPVAWVCAFIGALIPFVATLWIGKKLKIKNPIYYLFCGAMTAAFTVILFMGMNEFSAHYVISGLVAGFTCWLIIRPR
jgi:hypothetical protein